MEKVAHIENFLTLKPYIMEKKAIVSRMSEVRYRTLNPAEMLNMFIAERVDKRWEETFVDEETGKKVKVQRQSPLYVKGTLIDQDVLAKIKFDISSGDLKEPIEVSNQNRTGYEWKHTGLQPWEAKVEVDNRKMKFLLYAQNVDNALVILRDYVELNYKGGFAITHVGEFSDCVILEDTLSDRMSEKDVNTAYLKGEIDMDTYIKASQNGESASDSKDNAKKYYQMELTVTARDSKDEFKHTDNFVVHTFDTERAMIVIKSYLKMRDDERCALAEKDGREYERRTFSLLIEKAAPIPVGCFIPLDFSLVYTEK